MGQSASSQRDREAFRNRDSRRISQLIRERVGRSEQAEVQPPSTRRSLHAHTLSTPSPGFTHQTDHQQNTPFATFSRQISAQSVPASGDFAATGNSNARDSIFYEQHEERPLRNMEDLGMRDAPITNITATPLPRRTSVLSRLGTRFLPRSRVPNPAEQDDRGGMTADHSRRRMSHSLPSRHSQGQTSLSHHRLSLLDSLSPANHSFPRSRRRRNIASISQPYPIAMSSPVPSQDIVPPVNSAVFEASDMSTSSPEASDQGPLTPRRSRFSRIRNSLSTPLETLLSTSRSSPPPDADSIIPPLPLLRNTINPTTDFQLPPISAAEPPLEFQGLQTPSAIPLRRDDDAQTSQNAVETAESPQNRTESSSWTERWPIEQSALGESLEECQACFAEDQVD